MHNQVSYVWVCTRFKLCVDAKDFLKFFSPTQFHWSGNQIAPSLIYFPSFLSHLRLLRIYPWKQKDILNFVLFLKICLETQKLHFYFISPKNTNPCTFTWPQTIPFLTDNSVSTCFIISPCLPCFYLILYYNKTIKIRLRLVMAFTFKALGRSSYICWSALGIFVFIFKCFEKCD